MRVSTTPRRLRHLLAVTFQSELGERIKQARDDAGLSQAELASAIGLSHPQSVSNYERGLTEVPPRRLRQIAEATRRPIGFFVDAPPEDSRPIREQLAEMTEMLSEVLRRLPEAGLPRRAGGTRRPG